MMGRSCWPRVGSETQPTRRDGAAMGKEQRAEGNVGPGGQAGAAPGGKVGSETQPTLPPGVKLLRMLEGHKDRVLSVAFDLQGGMLASGSGGGTVKRWEATSGKLLQTLDQGGATQVVGTQGEYVLVEIGGTSLHCYPAQIATSARRPSKFAKLSERPPTKTSRLSAGRVTDTLPEKIGWASPFKETVTCSPWRTKRTWFQVLGAMTGPPESDSCCWSPLKKNSRPPASFPASVPLIPRWSPGHFLTPSGPSEIK
jgi:WD40 repeat protein